MAGAEIAGERLALGLMKNHHDVTMIVGTRGDASDRFEQNGIKCYYVPFKHTGNGLGIGYHWHRHQLKNLLKKIQPDIVHSNDLPTHQMTSDVARTLAIPTVCHHRWIFGPEATDWFNKFGASQHLFVSNAVMIRMKQQSKTLNQENCRVLYDGLEIPDLPSGLDRQTAKKTLRLDINKTTVLFAGQIVKRKGVAEIIRAWSLLTDAEKDQSELAIVGDDLESKGQYLSKMKQLAADLRVDARFAGFQRNVGEWITASDFVLVPSHEEPLGNATLEAMALGRTVIGCKVGGIPEMIEHERTGLLVRPKDPEHLKNAISQLINNPEKREIWGQQAREKCESKFAVDEHIEQCLNVYESLL